MMIVDVIKKPTKKEITKFLKDKYPDIHFDGIEFVDTTPDRLHFKVISFGRMIGQADYLLNDKFYLKVENHLNWTFK